MERLEILLATRDANPENLIEKMNIQSPLIIASQGETMALSNGIYNNVSYQVIRTKTKGVGINRNIALSVAKEEYLLFADDDVTYVDGYEKEIINAFKRNPKCDVLILRMKFSKNGEIYEEDHFKTRRIHLIGGLSFGTYQIAVRKRAIEKTNIHFSHLFGGGCRYSAGEDSLFLIDCYKKLLKVYTLDYLLGENRKDVSSWYTGTTRKFFFDKGVFASVAFPGIKYLFAIYFSVRQKSDNIDTNTVGKRFKTMCEGIKNGDSLISFEEYLKTNG